MKTEKEIREAIEKVESDILQTNTSKVRDELTVYIMALKWVLE